jgi:hypothetical protein
MSKRTSSPAKADVAQEYRKPRADVYTVLLVIALLAILVATGALWMTMKDDYNNDIKGGPNPTWHRPASGTVLDVPQAFV